MPVLTSTAPHRRCWRSGAGRRQGGRECEIPRSGTATVWGARAPQTGACDRCRRSQCPPSDGGGGGPPQRDAPTFRCVLTFMLSSPFPLPVRHRPHSPPPGLGPPQRETPTFRWVLTFMALTPSLAPPSVQKRASGACDSVDEQAGCHPPRPRYPSLEQWVIGFYIRPDSATLEILAFWERMAARNSLLRLRTSGCRHRSLAGDCSRRVFIMPKQGGLVLGCRNGSC